MKSLQTCVSICLLVHLFAEITHFISLQTIYMDIQRVESTVTVVQISHKEIAMNQDMNVSYLTGLNFIFRSIHCIHQLKGKEAERQILLHKWY